MLLYSLNVLILKRAKMNLINHEEYSMLMLFSAVVINQSHRCVENKSHIPKKMIHPPNQKWHNRCTHDVTNVLNLVMFKTCA